MYPLNIYTHTIANLFGNTSIPLEVLWLLLEYHDMLGNKVKALSNTQGGGGGQPTFH